MASALLVVPDKLAVYEDLYPDDLDRVGPRPVESLLAAPDLPIVYPLDDLLSARSGGEEIHPRTDTHFTFRGNELLFASVATALGIERLLGPLGHRPRRVPDGGRPGDQVRPADRQRRPRARLARRAEVAEDNRDEFVAVGAHIGTRRVFHNRQAADSRVAVVFGDSFAFAGPRYQGVSWFLAQAFRETHFVWVPFGWDAAYVRRVGAEAVLSRAPSDSPVGCPTWPSTSRGSPRRPCAGGRALGVEQVSS